MTGMLASVNSVVEAAIALQAGVDVLDIKNPQQGALGALKIDEVKDIVQFVNGQLPTSATIGDINSDDPRLLDCIISMAATGVDYVKVGLFATSPSDYFIQTIKQAVKARVKLVIVVFAESYQSMDILVDLMQAGIVGIMLDTREKKSKNLNAILKNSDLKKFVGTIKAFDLMCGLAGSLRFQDVHSLLGLNADYLGFRGALCSGSDRVNSIDAEQVKKIRALIPFSKLNINSNYKVNHHDSVA